MTAYQEARVKLTNTQLSKLKSASKNKTGTILRINKKKLQDEELPLELFLTTRQTSKIRNALANNKSTDIKLSKAQISKIIQSYGSFGSWFVNLGKKALTDLAFPLARGNFSGLVSNLAAKAINKFERKISENRAVRAGKRFTLFISNEDMNDITEVIKPLEDSYALTDGITETVKHEIKNKKADFFLIC